MTKRANPFRQMLEFFDGGRRWDQGELDVGEVYDPDTERYLTTHCLIGGWIQVAGVTRETAFSAKHVAAARIREHDMRLLERGIAMVTGQELSDVDVVEFNDDDETTWADVEPALEKAALLWDEEDALT